MDYLDFHCSFRGYSKDLYKILFMSTFIAVLAVVVKNLCSSMSTFIVISALVVENYLDFCLCQLLIMWTSIAVFGVVVKTYIGFYLCGLSL